MDNSIILAQILGIIFLVTGLELLLKRKFVSAAINDALDRPASLWIMGFIALIVGAIMVPLRNLWTSDWRVVIPIIGWVALLKAIVILFFPEFTVALYRKWNAASVLVFSAIVTTVLGLFLLWLGFGL
ncbi:MAG: hypothetical protein ABSD31_20740 [Candidatus Binataceae bacterium]|jgi:hypothetical protein